MAMLVSPYSGLSQQMKLDDIVTEICQRVNDPFEDNYKERSKELFVASLFQQMYGEKWTRFDYHGLIGSQEFSTGEADNRDIVVLGLYNSLESGRYIANILDIVSTNLAEDDPATRKFVPISLDEANRIATDIELEPIVGEVYWYIAGTKLFFHPSPDENMKHLSYIIEYLVNPKKFEDDVDMLEFYSVAYVYEAIEMAVGKLLSEIGLA